MKNLIVGAAAALGLLAGCAHSARSSDETTTASAETKQDTRTHEDWEQAKEKTADAAKATGEAVKTTANEAGVATADQGTFKEEKAFQLEGTLKRQLLGEVLIEREGLPPASLDVRDETKITLDGRQVAASDIPEGSEVRAAFQLEGNETVAVSIEAQSARR